MEGRTQTQGDGVGRQAVLLGLAPVEAADLEKGPTEAGQKGSGCSRCSRAPQPMAPMEAFFADSFAASPPSYRTSGRLRPPTGDSEGGQEIGGTWLLLPPDDHLPPPALAPALQAGACQRPMERLASHSQAAGSWLPQGLPAQLPADLLKPLQVVELLPAGHQLVPAGHQVHGGTGSTAGGRPLASAITKIFQLDNVAKL